MAELKESRQIYYIPDNYMEEGRILQGAVKVKNLVQGILFALPLALVGWTAAENIKFKIVLAIILAGPVLFLGIVGFNDDSLVTVIKSYKEWNKNKALKLYNPNPTPFYASPTDTIFSREQTKDKIVGAYEERQRQRLEAHLNAEMVEGKTFEFAEDPTVKKYHNESQKPVYAAKPKKTAVAISGDDIDDLDDLNDDWSMPVRSRKTLDMNGEETS